MPRARVDLPSTLERSDAHAQAIYADTLANATKEYAGDEARAHRTAFAALKHSYEKVGDHWEAKAQRGASDARSELHGKAALHSRLPTAEGVDAHASKQHLLDLARRLDVKGRSRMTKAQLVDAPMKANRRASQQARDRS